jgi:pimeloyl-ACP methyl ester carboxylesterase
MAVIPTFTALGSGPTVLMLHDADGGHLTFAPQVERLATQGYRAIAWDMPGYGHSAPIEPYTFKGLAESCLALIDALQCGPVALVGHGMGAMVALETLVRRPSAAHRLVLCAGGPALDADAHAAWVSPRLQTLQSLHAAGGGMERVAQTMVPKFVGTGAVPEGVRLAVHALSQVYEGSYRRALGALSTFDRGVDVLARLAMPTLVLSGEDDPCTTPTALQALATVMPDARHVILPHVGHWPQLEDPDNFDGALLDFLVAARVLH